MSSTTPTRRPYKGSCHCGQTRYIVFLTLPHPSSVSEPTPKDIQRIYRCNCTVCHKAGYFHVRVASLADDFLLLSPTDPLTSLGDYLCNDKHLHFLFCKNCGGQCLIFCGEGEVVDVDLAALGVPGTSEPGTMTKAWKPKVGGEGPEKKMYLSVNGHSVDAGQDGWDMRELTENKSLFYLDCLDWDRDTPARIDRPHEGGCY